MRDLLGVAGVSDQIVIKSKVSSSVVKSDIEAALKRRAKSDAQHISVEVRGADVTLTGTVHSWSEREIRTRAYPATPRIVQTQQCSFIDSDSSGHQSADRRAGCIASIRSFAPAC
jgi:hypothetical protein